MKAKRLNVVIKPNREVEEYAIKVSKKLAEKGNVLFVLDGIDYFPHLTMYSPDFPENSYGEMVRNLRGISAKYSVFKVKFTLFDSEDGYIGINIDNNELVKSLHADIVNTLNPLRKGILREKYQDPEYVEKLSENQQKNIATYGYPAVMDEFTPHLTLIRFDNGERAKEVAKTLVWEIKDLKVEELGIFEMGENGTCTKLVNNVKLP